MSWPAHRAVRVVLLAVLLAPLVWPAPAEAGERWQLEAGGGLAVLLSPGFVGRDVNDTGGEELRATLPDGPLLGLRMGWSSAYAGFELETASGLLPVEVDNEHGVEFPRHGEPPAFAGAQVALYPAGRRALAGRVRPYVLAGVGVLVLSVDLDNAGGQEQRVLADRLIGAGLRGMLGAGRGREPFLDLRVVWHSIERQGPIAAVELRTFGVSFGVEL